MRAAILSIGDELVLGQVVDTNSAYLAGRLAEHGVLCTAHLTVADDQGAIVRALRGAAEAVELVIVTGGLGPTDDDLTRPALAELLGVELFEHESSVRQIEAFFRQRKRQMPERNRLQAMCPAGARMLDNPIGTAPGIYARCGRAEVFCVPGVPQEMVTLYERHILPFLHERQPAGGTVILTAKVNTFGTGESTIADLLGDLMDRRRNPLVGTTVSGGIVSARVRSTFASRAEAQARLDETLGEVERRLGDYAFGRDDQTLEQELGRLLNERGKTLATAESCTGGLLSKLISDATGCSRYFLGGFVSYSNDAKSRDLGVGEGLLREHGAVSEPVALAMADGARRCCDSDYALSVTGIAGPGNDGSDKPVGTVWIGLAERDRPTAASLSIFAGTRSEIRERSANAALNMLRLRLLRT